jgi:hypothetical protein
MANLSREVIEKRQTARILRIDDCTEGFMRGDYTCSIPGRGKCQGYNCQDGYYKPQDSTK